MTKTTTSGGSTEPPPAPDVTITTTNNHPTTSASSSSTSSSPVLVDHPSSPHDTLLMSSPLDDDDHHDDDDDGEMTSSEDDQPHHHHHDPLLPEVEQSKPPECSSTMASITTTTTTTSTILQMILEQYQKWLIKGWKQIRHSKLSSISSSSIPYNEWLQFYCQFISSPSHQDKILKFLQYTFYMIGQVLLHSRRPSPPNHPPTVAPWLEQLYQALTWTRYVLRILQFPVAIDAALHQSWTRSAIPNISSSDGGSDSSSTSSSGRSGCSTCSHKSNTVAKRQQIYNVLGRILTYSMVLYYPTELMAYLLWMKPKASTSTSAAVTEIPPKLEQPSMTTTLICDSHQQYGYMISFISNVYTTLRDPKIRDKNNSSSSSSFLLSKLFSSFVVPSMTCPSPETWSYLSCRCWLIYVITELIQSYIQYKELLLSFTQPSNPTTDSSEYRNAQQQQQQQIVLQTVRNVLFLIPCATWSMPKWDTQPIVPSRTVNTLLWFESIVSLYQAILIQQQNKNRPPQQ